MESENIYLPVALCYSQVQGEGVCVFASVCVCVYGMLGPEKGQQEWEERNNDLMGSSKYILPATCISHIDY